MVQGANRRDGPVAEELRFETACIIVRPSRLPLYVAGICSVIGVALLAGDHMLGYAVQVVALTVGAVHLVHRPRKRSPTRIGVSARALYLDGVRVATCDDVVGISVATTSTGPLVSLSLRAGRALELGLDPEHIAELRAALGLSVARSASRTFNGHTPLGCIGSILTFGVAIIAACYVVAPINTHHTVLLGTLFPLILLGIPVAIGRLCQASVTCGEDGIHVKRIFGSRFLPYGRLLTVHTPSRAVVAITTMARDVHALELPTTEDALALVADAQSRMTTKRAEQAENLVSVLARGNRNTTEWLGAIRARSAPSTEGYRTARLPDDALWGVLEDPNVDPTARVAAALTLRSQAGAERSLELERRVRIAAGTTASPQVRLALEGVVDALDDEQVLTRVKRAGL